MQTIDYDYSDLSEAEIQQHMNAMKRKAQQEAEEKRRLMREAHDFHWSGGMC